MITKEFHNTQDAMRAYGLMQVPESGCVVEVGCNTGITTAPFFINTSARYIGIDNQKKKIETARRLFPSLRFMCIDCLSPEGRKIIKTADILISFQTLEHIGTPQGDEDLQMLSWLKKGAKVIISVPNFNSATHVRFYNHEKWTERFAQEIHIEELCIYHSIKLSGIRKDSCSYLYKGYKI